ncbi:MAG: sarcosine oxidase subunit gamma [Alphaproteobacteria bacterium]|nr:sarcosine oxidase subunit gamma [Alphaproteobacteria bacterium]
MANPALFGRRRSPLQDHDAALVRGAVAGPRGVTLKEIPHLAQITLRGDADDADFIGAVRAALGFELPLAANTVAVSGDVSALWLGPDEWLVVGAPDSETDLSIRLNGTLKGQHVLVVDVTANRTVLELSGPSGRGVLEKACGLDLRPRAFKPGQCAQTNLARTVGILELGQSGAWRIYVRNSFALYLADWLLDAMAEYAIDAAL